jgi:hypothetical protein
VSFSRHHEWTLCCGEMGSKLGDAVGNGDKIQRVDGRM